MISAFAMMLTFAGCGNDDSDYSGGKDSEAESVQSETEHSHDSASETTTSAQTTTTTTESEPERKQLPVVKTKHKITYNHALLSGDRAFHENRAWMLLVEDSNTVLDHYVALVDTNGSIVYKRSCTELSDKYGLGSAEATAICHGYGVLFDGSSMLIVDKNGKECYSSSSGDANTKITFLAQVGDTFLISREEKGFADSSARMQLIDHTGKVIRDDITKGEEYRSEPLLYCGDGLYNSGSLFINTNTWNCIKTNSSFTFIPKEKDFQISGGGESVVTIDSFKDQKTFDAFQNNKDSAPKVKLYDSLYSNIDTYGEGKYYDDGVYYDNNGKKAVVPQIPDKVKIDKATRFSGGYAFLKMTGADNRSYIGAIDESGKLVYDPILIEKNFYLGENVQGYLPIAFGAEHYDDKDRTYTYIATHDDRGLLTIGEDDLSELKDLTIPETPNAYDAYYGGFGDTGYPFLSGGFLRGEYLDNTKFGYSESRKATEIYYVNVVDKTIINRVYEYEGILPKEKYEFSYEKEEKEDDGSSDKKSSSLDNLLQVEETFNSILGKNKDEALKTVSEALGIKFEEMFTEEQCYDQKTKTNLAEGTWFKTAGEKSYNVLGEKFRELSISYMIDSKKFGGLSFHADLDTDPNDDIIDKSLSPKEAKKLYDRLYRIISDKYGDPGYTDNKPFWEGDYEYCKWYNKECGNIELCWGSKMYDIKGYNPCILSLSDPEFDKNTWDKISGD